ncbi:cadherin repeat domain-containing protein [Flagellimonas myxillae]|uniref:cadherin repeat domain-containing protein n=1 Tax=Flagellimonas myxillae TaxID=2942214 RepID=UPI00201F5B44|nr:cadherin repeat domain-containing protein [Muricauda myxillae]MCL6266690.1 cadherin repeat domain-containing protein [Muricauda myxillae]
MKLKNLFVMAIFALAAVSCSKDDGKDPNGVPSITPDQIFNLPETKVPGDNLGKVQASDPDGDPLTYSISGEAGPFVINSTTGVLGLAEGQSLDFDTTNTYTLTIKVTDNSDTATETITINVIQIDPENLAPLIVEDQEFPVDENVTEDFIIGSVQASDPEEGALTFSITTDASELFEISEDGKLSLVVGASLDY